MRRSQLFWVLGLLAIVAFTVYYYRLDPAQVSYLPQCPVYKLTGWQCAGCGGQRSVHALIHGHFEAAFWYNPLLYVLGTYLMAGQAVHFFPKSSGLQKVHTLLFGKVSVALLVFLVFSFVIIRNVWPNWFQS